MMDDKETEMYTQEYLDKFTEAMRSSLTNMQSPVIGDPDKTFSFTITKLPRWKSIILGFLNRIENWIIGL